MISKFFIERPVLANVLAILMVVIGAVALLSLPVAQYPNVVPPTISVTTRYPGASARTVVDTVALPIEQQVNGVDGMIYMQSYQRLRRHLHADRDVRDRHRHQLRPGAGAEPGLQRAGVAAAVGAGAGRDGPAEIDRDPAVRHAHLAGRPLRQPVPAPTTRPSTCRTSSPRLPGVGNVTSSAPASIRCGSGSIPNKLQARGSDDRRT